MCWIRESLSSEHTNLYRNGVLRPICGDNKCKVTHDIETNNYELSISSVQHYDAGYYSCRVCLERNEQVAQLIVLQPGESLVYSANIDRPIDDVWLARCKLCDHYYQNISEITRLGGLCQ